MNDSQKMFYDFYMKLIKPGVEKKAEAILAENFRKQDEGSFDKQYLENVIPVMLELVREEEVEHLKQVMQRFAKEQR